MAINFSGGQQNAPSALIQVQHWHISGPQSSNSNQSAWYDFIGAGNNYGITLKRDNSTIILHQSLNIDINGGSTGHFLRWQYRIGTGGTWTDFNSPTSPGSRQSAHFNMRSDSSNDMRHRAHRQILTTSSAAGTTIFFKLQSYLIPGAAYIKLNHANNDSDSTNNSRCTSFIFLEEFSNPT